MILVRKLVYLPLILLTACHSPSYDAVEEEHGNLTAFVNPLIGTGDATTPSSEKFGGGNSSHAQVIPGVGFPFGMTQWTPQTRASEAHCLAPYYYADTRIQGFRGTHWMSGSCTQDYGSMTIMPLSGRVIPDVRQRASSFSHQRETARANYYQVFLDDYQVNAEVTAENHSAVLRFTWMTDSAKYIVFNPNSDEGEGFVEVDTARNEIRCYNPVHRIYQGLGEPAGFNGWFVIKLPGKVAGFGVWRGDSVLSGVTTVKDVKNIGAWIKLSQPAGEPVTLKVGASFTSFAAAEENLEMEIGGHDFDSVRKEGRQIWNHVLQRVDVDGGTDQDRQKFYTALYHSMLLPRQFSDDNGTFPKFDKQYEVETDKTFVYYGDFSMWDTFRAEHPLLTILQPERSHDMMESLLEKGYSGGWLPIFPAWNNYTSEMIGDHAVATLADAAMKGIIDLTDDDYELMRRNAMETPADPADYVNGKGRRALTSYLKYGYIPLEDEVKDAYHHREQVSRTLEYAYDDFALSQVAGLVGERKDKRLFRKRSMNFKNVFDPTVKSVRGRHADGSWSKDFDREKSASFISEGTPWQYTWFVPQDIGGLIKMMGGEKEFNQQLDAFFARGQYWHGNEPGHQIPFLYNYSGQPWKTQEHVAQIRHDEYSDGPGGLSGNDDAGQISAWYVFSCMGFYPVCPSVPEYVLFTPAFDKITLNLENGNRFTVLAPGASSGKLYIQSVTLNGRKYRKNYIRHSDIVKGGVLEMKLGEKPNKNWGTARRDRPFSLEW
jgi:predicted alpha-1,2-mannosidase